MAFSNSLFQLADAPYGTGAANALQCRTGLDISYGLIWPSQINLNISTRFVKNSTFQNSQGKITQMCLQYLPPPCLPCKSRSFHRILIPIWKKRDDKRENLIPITICKCFEKKLFCNKDSPTCTNET